MALTVWGGFARPFFYIAVNLHGDELPRSHLSFAYSSPKRISEDASTNLGRTSCYLLTISAQQSYSARSSLACVSIRRALSGVPNQHPHRRPVRRLKAAQRARRQRVSCPVPATPK